MKDQERLKRQIGQRICAGFTGTEVTEEIRKLVREWKVGNILLYSRNVVSFPQLKQLCRDLDALIREETGQPALIMIDEERIVSDNDGCKRTYESAENHYTVKRNVDDTASLGVHTGESNNKQRYRVY